MFDKSLINAGANLSGRATSALATLITAPLIVAILGTESYGVIAFTFATQALFSVFDLGISATVKREIAASLARGEEPFERQTILRTFELLYWGGAIVVGALLFLTAPFFSRSWLRLSSLPVQGAAEALKISAAAIALRWPVALYGGVLLSYGTQVRYNLLFAGFAILRNFGAVLILRVAGPKIAVFFIWLAVASIIETSVFYLAAWQRIGFGHFFKVSPSRAVIMKTWRFSLSFSLAGTFSMLSSVADRLILGARVSTSLLGIYSLAGTPAGVLTMVGDSVSVALFPEAAGRWCVKDREGLENNFLKSVARAAIASVGSLIVLTVAAEGVLRLWIGKADIVAEAGNCLIWLSLAYFMRAIANPAYTLLVACGKTKLPLFWNAAYLVVGSLAVYLAASRGIVAVSIVMAVGNAAYALTMFAGAFRLVGTSTKTAYRMGLSLRYLASVAALNVAAAMYFQSGPSTLKAILLLAIVFLSTSFSLLLYERAIRAAYAVV